MNLKINTSLRGRGKWGDFLVAIIPLSWCANILLNSNFILRMIEWQNESSIFTVRIHGKQWYWVYKFDLSDTIGILTAPKNIGRDKWIINTPNDIIVAESYLQAIQLRSQHDWVQNYWKEVFNDVFVSYENSKILNFNKNTNNKLNKLNSFKNLNFKKFNFINENNNNFFNFFNSKLFNNQILLNFFNLNNLKNKNFYSDYDVFFKYFKLKDVEFIMYDFNDIFDINKKNKNFVLLDYFNNYYYNYDKLDDLWDVQRSATRKSFKVYPFRIVKNLIKYDFFENNNDLIKFKYFSENNILSTKTFLNENYWVLKQKRYKKKIKFFEFENPLNFKNEFQPFFENNKIIRNASIENYNDTINLYELNYNKKPETLYKLIRNNKQRSEALPIHLCRRLLRTIQTQKI